MTHAIKRPQRTEQDIIVVIEGVRAAFRDGALRATGTAITEALPPVSRFSKNKNHSAKKQHVTQRLGEFFERIFGIGQGGY